MMKVNGERLLADLRMLAQFGAEGTGVNRLSLTPPDIDSRAWLLGRMKEAGLEARIDGLGSVYGQTPGVSRAILIGSHTEFHTVSGPAMSSKVVMSRLANRNKAAPASLRMAMGVVPAWSAWP
jgi:hypothetical protein